MITTTPYPSAAKTDDRYFCAACGITDHADIVGDETSCAWCDSPELTTEEARNRELAREREAQFAEADAIADERRATYTEGCLLRRQAGSR